MPTAERRFAGYRIGWSGESLMTRLFFKSAGISLDEKKIIVVKSNQAHRASFAPVAAEIIDLDTPGACTVNYASLPYKMLPRPIYPVDLDMEWEP